MILLNDYVEMSCTGHSYGRGGCMGYDGTAHRRKLELNTARTLGDFVSTVVTRIAVSKGHMLR